MTLHCTTETFSEHAWSHYQVVYHGDQDVALRELVDPTVRELTRSGLIDRFFFVRYELGGPHLRLRFRRTGGEEDLRAVIDARTRQFFERFPSSEPWDRERILRTNRQIRGREALDTEPEPIFADQTWHRSPLGFEEERYGGAQLYGSALDLFALSSLRSLQFLRQLDRNDGRFQTAVVLEILQSALAFARDHDELLRLADYASGLFRSLFEPCREQAEARFPQLRPGLESAAEHCVQAVGDALEGESEELLFETARFETARSATSATPTRVDELDGTGTGLDRAYFRAARCYSGLLGERERAYALRSHLHMTANRLGVWNPEEVYLSRLAHLAVRGLDRQMWDRVSTRRQLASPKVSALSGHGGNAAEAVSASTCGVGP